ncbi:MAG: DUF6714 family protein [Candidatus Rokuibacteriota bacterium]|jgi:hypothetical protein
MTITLDEIVRNAFETFRADADTVPPLTLRGGNAVDSYDDAEPFDPARDEPTDAYLEGFAFWGLSYLDAQSWRHYLPRLISYAFRRPNDPAMAVEALIRSLRPPDRYPPRLASLTAEQEAVVVAFLEALALGDGPSHVRNDAQQALEEWWLPGARRRPRPEDVVALRSIPVDHHVIERARYRLKLPVAFVSSGARHIAEESRTVEVWSGVLCGDAPTMVAVNLTPLAGRHLHQIMERAAAGLRAARVESRPLRVPGAARSECLDGLTRGHSPTEPERIMIVVAVTGQEVVLLTVRSWPRDDVEAAMQRIVSTFEIARD